MGSEEIDSCGVVYEESTTLSLKGARAFIPEPNLSGYSLGTKI